MIDRASQAFRARLAALRVARRRIAFAAATIGALAAAAAGWAQWPTFSQVAFAGVAVAAVAVGMIATSSPPQPLTSPSFEAPAGHAPPLSSRFQKRPRVMTELETALDRGGQVAVVGPGGVGKTQLICSYVREHANEFALIWWIRSRHREVLSADFEQIAAALGLGEQGSDRRVAVEAWLTTHKRWLLVFDDVTNDAKVQDFLPINNGNGKAIITSRSKLDVLAEIVELDDWSSRDSLRFLNANIAGPTEAKKAISRQLFHVPLALDQAVAYMLATGLDASNYLILLEQNSDELLDSGRAFNRDDSIATTWVISADLAESEKAGAKDLLTLCSFYAGNAIPRQLPVLAAETHGVANTAPRHFRSRVSDELSFNALLAALSRQSLITMDGVNLYVHGLVQRAVRIGLTPRQRQRWTYYAAASLWLLLQKLIPQDGSGEQWQSAASLLPHVLSAAEQAEENVPREWPYSYNYPSWTAIRESARSLEAIAFGLWDTPDKEAGAAAALRGLELAVKSYPFLVSFMQPHDTVLAISTVVGLSQAVENYAVVTDDSERAEAGLRAALELFPKQERRPTLLSRRANTYFRFAVEARTTIRCSLIRVLVVAQKLDEARDLAQRVRADIARFKYLDHSGREAEIVSALLDGAPA